MFKIFGAKDRRQKKKELTTTITPSVLRIEQMDGKSE